MVLVTIGITYAYCLVTKSQAGENTILSGCLDITLEGQNDITLSDQFPMSDADGIFCNEKTDYVEEDWDYDDLVKLYGKTHQVLPIQRMIDIQYMIQKTVMGYLKNQ